MKHKIEKPWNVALYVIIAVLTTYESLSSVKIGAKEITGLVLAGLIALRAALDPSTSANKDEGKQDGQANH